MEQVRVIGGCRCIGGQPPPCEHDAFEVLPDRSFYAGGPTITVYRCETCGKEVWTP